MGTPKCFSNIFLNEGNLYDFQFTSPDEKAFQKRVLLLKERICSYRSKFFPLKVDPSWGGKNESDRVASPEKAPIHLKKFIWETIRGPKYLKDH